MNSSTVPKTVPDDAMERKKSEDSELYFAHKRQVIMFILLYLSSHYFGGPGGI